MSETQIDRRRTAAAAILGVLLAGSYFVASGDAGPLPPAFLINAVVLALAFWIPAMRIGRPSDVRRIWKQLAFWVPGWTLVWDLATSGVLGTRSLFQEWWIVYPAGLVFFFALFLLHGAVTARFTGPADEPGPRSRSDAADTVPGADADR